LLAVCLMRFGTCPPLALRLFKVLPNDSFTSFASTVFTDQLLERPRAKYLSATNHHGFGITKWIEIWWSLRPIWPSVGSDRTKPNDGPEAREPLFWAWGPLGSTIRTNGDWKGGQLTRNLLVYMYILWSY
jgi:hypothetical protein